MYQGQLVFTQLMDHLPRRTFRRLVQRYRCEAPAVGIPELSARANRTRVRSLPDVTRRIGKWCG
jgi:hypothetical protein